MNDLTLIIPAKNEKESLPTVIEKIKKFDYQITVSLKQDDKETIESIKNISNIQIFFQSGKGYGNSLKEAINSCKTKYYCIFNADGSFDPNDLAKMYNLINSNDFVYTTRYKHPGGSEDDTFVTYIGNQIFSKLGNLFFSLSISDILYTYIMGNTESFKKLNIKSNDFRFCVELPIKMQISGMKYVCIPSYEKKRIAGRKKVNAFKDGFLILIEMIKLFLIFKLFRKKIINK
ncbi:glycosyltransferase family 2 protein [Candidatus Pelagibacter sp.]|nr:glycosyltransferase family 2 protein [Candidatus Pelagibacter sp.]